MQEKVIIYDSLPEEAIRIREEVFMQEQGFQEEFDEIDGIAAHLVLYCGGSPAAVCRFYQDRVEDGWLIGRLAVRKPYRGKGIGAVLLSEAEKEIERRGGRAAVLHAQRQAQPFYEKQGYAAYGETDFDEGCPHVWMKKSLHS
ncbi:MAG TPA: GNAT family N-acetyltransferase [Candidatus Eisenbergiella intestinipullorum]|nr:GNAT family N-acetyltransferase [Candidatus Eisenbergiella intestinipullorum]